MRRLRLALAATVVGTLAVAQPWASASGGDPLAGQQWGLRQIHAQQAWATSRGAGVTIAIVDAGVDRGHPDLASKLVGGATFLGCGTTSCGDGDWLSGPAARRASASPHGTHVAGIAAAATGNGIGIAGVAPDATIMPVKVLDEQGGSFADIALGIRWAAAHGAKVVNLSLGAMPGAQALTLTGLQSEVRDAIRDVSARGVLVVAAAGNETAPLCDTPGFDAGALCVTATDHRELPASYSNLGVNQRLQAVAAPGGSSLPVCGEDILSTVPRGTGQGVCAGTSYDEMAGTSMATPHVTGVAALLAAQGRSRDDIIATLLATAHLPQAAGARGHYSPSYGYGIVDAARAVTYHR